MLTKIVLDKLEKKLENLPLDEKSSYLKAVAIGAAEGLIDSAVLIGTLSIANGMIEALSKSICKK